MGSIHKFWCISIFIAILTLLLILLAIIRFAQVKQIPPVDDAGDEILDKDIGCSDNKTRNSTSTEHDASAESEDEDDYNDQSDDTPDVHHQMRNLVLKRCPSSEVTRDSDLATQWWKDEKLSKALVCPKARFRRQVALVIQPNGRITEKKIPSSRNDLVKLLNRAVRGTAKLAEKFGNSVAEEMGYQNYGHWSEGRDKQGHLPCLPPPDTKEFLSTISRTGSQKTLAAMWHGNIQAYLLFFAMAGKTTIADEMIILQARRFACQLHLVLNIVRDLIIRMNMKSLFREISPPATSCMEKQCSYGQDPFARLAIAIRDGLVLLQDIQEQIESFQQEVFRDEMLT